MLLHEKEVILSRSNKNSSLIRHFASEVAKECCGDELPIRLAVTRTTQDHYECEIGIMTEVEGPWILSNDHIFQYRQRPFENTNTFNAVLLVPTGIDAAIGGDAGDAGPVAKLLASACDNLITHPNVVNASDINELSENGLYVEGSVISRLLMGTVGLQKVRSNRVMVILDKHEDAFFHEAAINSVSAAQATMGINIPEIVLMEPRISMVSLYSNSGRATGSVNGFERLCDILENKRDKYDAVALSSVIQVPENYHLDYFKNDHMVNPWGGVEAMLTHATSSIFNIPTAHSPMMDSRKTLNLEVGVVDPKKAAEAVSTTFLHCILKGLHNSPKIIVNPSLDSGSALLTATDISCLIVPDGCVGIPTLAAIDQSIPVIAVRENTNKMRNSLADYPFKPGMLHIVDNYLEAVGVVHALKSGVSTNSVRNRLNMGSIIHKAYTEKRSIREG